MDDGPAGQGTANSVREGGSAESCARDVVGDDTHVTLLEATPSIRGPSRPESSNDIVTIAKEFASRSIDSILQLPLPLLSSQVRLSRNKTSLRQGQTAEDTESG